MLTSVARVLQRTHKKCGIDKEIGKYHEVVNGAIMDAVVKPLGGKHTPKSCMLTLVARVLRHTYNKRGINKEMKEWRVRGLYTLVF